MRAVVDSIALGVWLDYGGYYRKWAAFGTYHDSCLRYQEAPDKGVALTLRLGYPTAALGLSILL